MNITKIPENSRQKQYNSKYLQESPWPKLRYNVSGDVDTALILVTRIGAFEIIA
jgi:hypothetical protein